jgi:hypothetical protein
VYLFVRPRRQLRRFARNHQQRNPARRQLDDPRRRPHQAFARNRLQ